MAKKISKTKYNQISKTVGRLIRMFHYVLEADKKSYRVCWFKWESNPCRIDIFTCLASTSPKLMACVQTLELFLSGDIDLNIHYVTPEHKWLKGWEGHTEEEMSA